MFSPGKVTSPTMRFWGSLSCPLALSKDFRVADSLRVAEDGTILTPNRFRFLPEKLTPNRSMEIRRVAQRLNIKDLHKIICYKET